MWDYGITSFHAISVSNQPPPGSLFYSKHTDETPGSDVPPITFLEDPLVISCNCTGSNFLPFDPAPAFDSTKGVLKSNANVSPIALKYEGDEEADPDIVGNIVQVDCKSSDGCGRSSRCGWQSEEQQASVFIPAPL